MGGKGIKILSMMVFVGLMLGQGGCSVYKVITQPGPADLKGIGVGTPRQMLISRLGAPIMVDNDAHGNKLDVFQFESGLHHAYKIRALPYLAADVFTLTLAELLLWPLELTAMDATTCLGTATYDSSSKVQSWAISPKNGGTSAQDC